MEILFFGFEALCHLTNDPARPNNIAFYNHVIRGTCVSVSRRFLATSYRFGRDKYLLSLNCFSSSTSCSDEKAVRGRLDLFKRPGCATPKKIFKKL